MATTPVDYFVRPTNGDNSNDGLSHANAWQTTQYALDNITRDASSGDRINVFSEATDDITATLDSSTYGSTASIAAPLIIQGYTTSPQDGGIGAIDGGGSAASIWDDSTFQGIHFYDMTLSGCTSTGIRPYHYSAVINCTLEDIGAHGIFSTGKYNTHAFNKVNCVGVYGIYGDQANHILNNYVEVSGTGGYGIRQAGGNCCAMYNTVVMTHASVVAGLDVSPLGSTAICNSIYHSGSPSGSGCRCLYFSQGIVAGNLIEGFATGVERGSADTYTLVRNNAAYNCTTPFDGAEEDFWLSPVPLADFDNQTLAASPFRDAASGDFRPTVQSMSLGGWPTQLPNVGTLTRYYKGAIQPGGSPIIGGARRGGRAA